MDEPKRQKMTLYDGSGARKYLTADERQQFLAAAATLDRLTRTFCMTLGYTGCRLSEALALLGSSIDFNARCVVFESLKKRRDGVYRAVPVPASYLEAVELAHGLRTSIKIKRSRLWPWSRRTGARRVKEVMQVAGVAGPHATAKGLRHGFAVTAVQSGVPLTSVQKWLGHSELETTAIYTDAMGQEEYDLASRMWRA